MKKIKSLLSVEEMIDELKKENIKFEKINEEEAKMYLRDEGNYHDIVLHKNNFERYFVDGKFIDKYVSLDFAYLKDISEIDFKLRSILFEMIMAIENCLKSRILNIIKHNDSSDGYETVNAYLEKDFNDEKFPKKLHNHILKRIDEDNYHKIFGDDKVTLNKPFSNVPIDVLVEIMTLGELTAFYEFIINTYKIKQDSLNVYVLRNVVKLRNAICHNTPILCKLGEKDNNYIKSYNLISYLEKCGISKRIRNNKLNNRKIRQITFVVYLFSKIVVDEKIIEDVLEQLVDFFYDRILLNKEYYQDNELLKSIYLFYQKIVFNFFFENNLKIMDKTFDMISKNMLYCIQDTKTLGCFRMTAVN